MQIRIVSVSTFSRTYRYLRPSLLRKACSNSNIARVLGVHREGIGGDAPARHLGPKPAASRFLRQCPLRVVLALSARDRISGSSMAASGSGAAGRPGSAARPGSTGHVRARADISRQRENPAIGGVPEVQSEWPNIDSPVGLSCTPRLLDAYGCVPTESTRNVP